MKIKDYQEYYERLAQAREELRKKLLGEEESHSLWSIKYKDSFKNTLYEMVSRRAGLDKVPIVLDVGCGLGFDLANLSKLSSLTGYGTDLSLTRLKVALSDNSQKKFKFVQADVQNLPFKDSSFDIVICSEVIEHLPEVNSCLKGIQRVLKKGGFLFVTTPNRWDYFHTIGQLIPKGLRKKLAGFFRGETTDVDSSKFVTEPGMMEHIHLFTFKEIKRDLENIGFSVEELKQGKLTVPFPRIFDCYRLLQFIWQTLDKIFNLFSFSKYLTATILVVAKKK
jgi:ubiquinone/menaquinone biosynthesis C-methylase UbiE